MDTAYEALLERDDVYRIVLEEYSEGVYVWVFLTSRSACPGKDHLQDSMAQAVSFCERHYNVSRDIWRPIPRLGLM